MLIEGLSNWKGWFGRVGDDLNVFVEEWMGLKNNWKGLMVE